MAAFVFVGERPSEKAVQIGATWQNGKLAAKQLHDAMRANQLEPSEHLYLNLWTGAKPHDGDLAHEASAIQEIRQYQAEGYRVVGMGQLVCNALARHGIAHTCIVHPAARGAIRRKDRYAAHLGAALALAEVA